ncbi:putative mitogen-activated protein kinase kinase kinase STE-STE11 family [Helianthus anomalus]
MKSEQLKTNKRSLLIENMYEVKRSKQEDWKKRYGDGVAWLRGAMIGRGNFGCVFAANLKNPKSRYSSYPPVMAVKSAEVSASGSIQKEKEVMDNLRGCPNVIKCFGEETTVGDNGQMVYNLLLEYGSGGTLADLVKSLNGEGLAEIEVRRYARSIVYGLSHIHKRGYVHCDLKPENVLLVSGCRTGTGEFVAKIGDLGLAKRVNHVKKNRLSCYWRGTPMYLSPEAVINGVQEPPADIWAVGCLVFQMLTGKPIWFSDQDLGIEEILSRICDENDMPFVSSGMSDEAVSFLKGCLCRKVMCRLTANMLLNHPFLKGLVEDNVNEIEESHEVFDIYAITSSSSFSDDDGEDADGDDDDDDLWSSSCSDESSYNLSSWSE